MKWNYDDSVSIQPLLIAQMNLWHIKPCLVRPAPLQCIRDSSVLQQISSNGRHPLPLECHGLVDQISWLACRQRVLETDSSRQSVPIEKCTWKERIFVDISSCRYGNETCVISAACLSRRLRQMTERWQNDHLLLWRKVTDDVPLCVCQTARASQVHQATWLHMWCVLNKIMYTVKTLNYIPITRRQTRATTADF